MPFPLVGFQKSSASPWAIPVTGSYSSREIHELRLFSCLQRDCVTLFQEKGCKENREDINNFAKECIFEILGGKLRKNKKISEELSYQVSTNDQRILFYMYIADIIAANLKKKCYWLAKDHQMERLDLLQRLTSKTSSTTFVVKHDQWLTKNSRGGLVRWARDFHQKGCGLQRHSLKDPNQLHDERAHDGLLHGKLLFIGTVCRLLTAIS